MNRSKIKKVVTDYLKRNGTASYPDIEYIFKQNGFDYHGNRNVYSWMNPNIVFWTGWNQEAISLMNELERNMLIHKIPADALSIMLGGTCPNYPRVSGKHFYKTPHWYPVVFKVGTAK